MDSVICEVIHDVTRQEVPSGASVTRLELPDSLIGIKAAVVNSDGVRVSKRNASNRSLP